jgi:hypothetical protein
MEIAPLTPSLQGDLISSRRFILDTADILSKLRNPLDEFQEFYVTDDRVKGFLDDFKHKLGQICLHEHNNGERAFPTYVALMEVATQCCSTLERFLSREKELQSSAMEYEEVSRSSLEKTKNRHHEWNQRRINAVVADLVGHSISIMLLSQLHDQTHQREPGALPKFSPQNIRTVVSRREPFRSEYPKKTFDIIYSNFRIFLAATALYERTSQISPQPELKKPVILNDALGRPAPFHLDFIQSHRAS